jgi:exopolyphosphatase/guanosine-5'-triphosphate,3'-diphosphate pyrophosphatase
MRLAVLDVGSNAAHLQVVEAEPGGPLVTVYRLKAPTRLADAVTARGALTDDGVRRVVDAVCTTVAAAREQGVSDLIPLATATIRDARNHDRIQALIRAATGLELMTFSGEEEARLTFLAVRRWFGWSAGRLLVMDIGGGSLELASGIDEEPDAAMSLPLGAGRLTREWLPDSPPSAAAVDRLTEHVDAQVAKAAPRLRKLDWDKPVATSKTFRTLARLAGAAPSAMGPRARRSLTLNGLHQVLAFIRRMPASALAEIDGVSARRAHQVLAGAVVAESTMRALGLESVEICPWALREGVILRRLDILEST